MTRGFVEFDIILQGAQEAARKLLLTALPKDLVG
jgi:hypothetical protein